MCQQAQRENKTMLNKLIANHIPRSEFTSTLHRIVEDILSVSTPLRVILFGSLARDQFKEGSDIDLAIIFSDCADPNFERRNIHRNRTELSVPIEFLVFRESEFESRLKSGGVCQIIADEGEVLFEREKH